MNMNKAKELRKLRDKNDALKRVAAKKELRNRALSL